MKIKVVPRKFFLDRKGTEEERKIFQEWNVISICTPAHTPTGFEREEIPFSPEALKEGRVLVLYFHDTCSKLDEEIVLFDEGMAHSIWEFLLSTQGNGKGYLIHCTAGISRSQAVGMVLNDCLNREENPKDFLEFEEENRNKRRPNSLVKRLLMRGMESHMEYGV